jgi:hypothetical protein
MKKIGYNYLILIGAMAVFGSDTRAALPVTDGLVIHLEADSITGASNGSRIATWTGLVGSGMDAVQPTADSQPVYVASNPLFKGHATVHFDGINDLMFLPSGANCPINVGACTVLVVAKFDKLVDSQYLFSGQGTSGNDRLRICIDGSITGAPFHWRIGNTGWPGTMNAPADTAVHVFGITSPAEGFLDGVSIGTASNTASDIPSDFGLGAGRVNNPHSFLLGDIAEFVVFNRVLDATEYAQVNAYLALKYTLSVSDPNPQDDATDVALDATLQWNAAPDPANTAQTDPLVKKHYVWMDTDNADDDPNLYLAGQITVTDWTGRAASFVPSGAFALNYDQSVSWQIEEGLDNGLGGVYAPGDPNNWRGPIWSFATVLSLPSINPQPQSAMFAAGDPDVALSLSATSAFMPLTYQWYKDTAIISDGAEYSGTQSNTLVILNPDLADEGSYYCKVTADNGGSIDSDLVFVKMRRMVAHYQFEQNVEDSAGTNHGIVMNGGLAYSAGVPNLGGQTWAADPNGFNYVQLTTDAYPNNGFGNAFRQGSISFWAKTESSGFQVLLGSANTGTTTLFQIELPGTTGRANLYMRDNDGTDIVASSASPITDGQWHYIVATYQTDNGSGSSAKIYVDGVSGVTATGSALDNLAAWEFPMVLMGRNNRGTIDARYSGMVDDLQIYNYELTAEQIADTYYNVTGKQSCILEYASQFDLTGPDGQPDCKVDLYDLTAMSAVWLDSGLYPILP